MFGRNSRPVLHATGCVRDRLLFATLAETGMRLGEASSLRHHDFHLGTGATPYIEVAGRQDHPRGARGKTLRGVISLQCVTVTYCCATEWPQRQRTGIFDRSASCRYLSPPAPGTVAIATK